MKEFIIYVISANVIFGAGYASGHYGIRNIWVKIKQIITRKKEIYKDLEGKAKDTIDKIEDKIDDIRK